MAARVFDVVIADDDANIRMSLRGLFSDQARLNVVGEAADGRAAAELCGHTQPALAVVDVMMPSGGCEAVTAIRAASPNTIVVGYTARTDRRTCARLLDAGAAAVFAKGGSVDLVNELVALVDR